MNCSADQQNPPGREVQSSPEPDLGEQSDQQSISGGQSSDLSLPIDLFDIKAAVPRRKPGNTSIMAHSAVS